MSEKVYIEREAVKSIADELIAELESMFDNEEINEEQFAYLVGLTNRYITIPRAVVKPVDNPVVKGKWEWLSSTYDRVPCHMIYRCSNCRQQVMTHGQEPWEYFCPNCGAAMNEEALRIIARRKIF